ncbi:TonB-dependent receptor plug domain-containing protein [Roseateles sp.]|uniref:TonB-dependent receptor plug domain-containing protein n=1 Tax=Roseateles sp. TaxID=1971397 RepID=UPI003BAC090B
MSHTLLAASRPASVLFALSTLAVAASAHAQALNKLDTVVTTATRTPQRLADVLADLTVITRADIERQASASLGDLLRNNGCAEMVRNGGPASTTSLYLRGAETRHTLVLVDGVRVDSQSTGGASWQGIPLGQIERVEVLKGPASAIYGSDAVGGVVQIFTRKGGSKTALDLGVAAGNLGTRKADAAVYGSAGIFDYALSAGVDRSDGFNATTLDNAFGYVPDRDGYRRYEASARLGAQLAEGHRAEVVAIRSHVNGQYDASKSKPLVDDHTLQDTDAARLSWTAQWSPALQTQLSYGESRDRYETTPSPYLTITRIKNLALSGYYQLAQGQQITFTGERDEDKLENSSLVATDKIGKRSRNAVGAGYILNAGAFGFQAHARHDDDSQFGGVDTGTLLAGYEVAPGLRVVGSIGNAFRAPTVYQQASLYGPLSKPGTPLLEAENGHNVEFGLKYAAGDNEISATAYRNRVSNLIIFGAAGPCSYGFGCYQNVALARLQGLTLAGGTKVAMVNLKATLDLQAPKDVNTGLLLARRAKRLGTVNADTELGDWLLGAGVQWSGARFDNAANTRKLGGYGLMNLSAQYKISRELKMQLNVDNAFDRDYTTAYGYASAPRTVLVSLRWSPQL